MIHYYHLILQPHPGSTNYSNKIESHVEFSCHLSLFSFNLENFFTLFFDFHDLGTFEGYSPVILKNVPQVGFPQTFFSSNFKLEIFGKNSTEMVLYPFHCTLVHDILFVPLRMMFTSVT